MLAHYALHELKIRPSELFNMERKEKAFIYASIQIRIKEEKEQQKRIEKKK